MILILNAEFMHRLAWEQMRLRLSAQVRGMRLERGWTWSQLAKRANIQLRNVWRVENCYLKHISIKTLTSIAHAFDVALDIRFISLLSSLFPANQVSEGGYP